MKFLKNGQVTIIIGLPRSGKTLFATKIAKLNEKEFDRIVTTHDMDLSQAFFSIPVFNMDCKEIFSYKWDHTLFILDEGSLNGLDARDHAKNFGGGHGSRMLATLKTLGHSHNSCIITNHSFTDNDSKIRDSLSGTFFRARGRFLFWCIVEELTVTHKFVPEEGKYMPVVDNPGPLLALITGQFHFVSRRKYGKFYNSFTVPPILQELPANGGSSSGSSEEKGGLLESC